MTARIWWRIRDWWHYPNMYQSCLKPTTFWDEPAYYWIFWHQRAWGALARLIWRHMRAAVYRGYFRLRWWSQLRCNGNRGGWRTRFCEWLEDNAREAEEKAGSVAQ